MRTMSDQVRRQWLDMLAAISAAKGVTLAPIEGSASTKPSNTPHDR